MKKQNANKSGEIDIQIYDNQDIQTVIMQECNDSLQKKNSQKLDASQEQPESKQKDSESAQAVAASETNHQSQPEPEKPKIQIQDPDA